MRGARTGHGFAEQAVQAFEGMFRVHKLNLETKVGEHIPCGHPVVAWLTEYVAEMLNRHIVGKDGRTPDQRLDGSDCVGIMLEFGSGDFSISGKVYGGPMQEGWFPGVCWEEAPHR